MNLCENMKIPTKVLFILRQRTNKFGQDDGYSYCGNFSSGLYNSANFVHEMLLKEKIPSKIVEVFDSNFIDREVCRYRPTHVILEAIFCPPDKFKELTRLHSKVKFIIRNHSEIPFLSTEGNAVDWMLKYVKYPNVFISCNSKNANEDFIHLISTNQNISIEEAKKKVIYLPNYYPVLEKIKKDKTRNKSGEIEKVLNVGCFGAVRPLKSILIQAIAAIRLADIRGIILHFHINGSRVEGNGDPILKNLRLLFSNIKKHKLVEHSWVPHGQFLELISNMDIIMQVSLSETFNVICADAVSMGIPVVSSPEVFWLSRLSMANPTNTNDIIQTIKIALDNIWIPKVNKFLLKRFCNNSKEIWMKIIHE